MLLTKLACPLINQEDLNLILEKLDTRWCKNDSELLLKTSKNVDQHQIYHRFCIRNLVSDPEMVLSHHKTPCLSQVSSAYRGLSVSFLKSDLTQRFLFASTTRFLFRYYLITEMECWNESWNSNTLATWCEELTHWKRSWCCEMKVGGEGDKRGWDGWMASPTRQTWVWTSFGSWWWTGKPGVPQSMGPQRVRHDWLTELNQLITGSVSKCPKWLQIFQHIFSLWLPHNSWKLPMLLFLNNSSSLTKH